MALRQDDRALLQLVCERGQSYADLAQLLGISEQEVRAKARAALTELGGADPDAEVGLTDYLLGQADPIGRADAVRFLQDDAEARELAQTIVTKLEALAPGAKLPTVPAERGRRRSSPKPAAPAPPPPPTETPPAATAPDHGARRRAQVIGILAGGAVIVIFAALAIAGVFSSDEPAASEPINREGPLVRLAPEEGSGVSGSVRFSVVNDQLVADVKLRGLDPKPGEGEVYALWMMLTRKQGYPVELLEPADDGTVDKRLELPDVATAIGVNSRFVRVSLSNSEKLGNSLVAAVNQGKSALDFSGEGVAIGRIPLAASDSAAADAGAADAGAADGGTTTTGAETTPQAAG